MLVATSDHIMAAITNVRTDRHVSVLLPPLAQHSHRLACLFLLACEGRSSWTEVECVTICEPEDALPNSDVAGCPCTRGTMISQLVDAHYRTARSLVYCLLARILRHTFACWLL
jgi:hypothetical protein